MKYILKKKFFGSGRERGIVKLRVRVKRQRPLKKLNKN